MKTVREKIAQICLGFLFSVSAPSVNAVVIDFDSLGAAANSSLTGVFVEDGYTLDFVDMFYGTGSTSTPDFEVERLFGTSGTLTISAGGQLFDVLAWDWESEQNSTSATVVLQGFLLGVSQGSVSTTVGPPSGYATTTGPFGPLTGIDSLVIRADRTFDRLGSFDTLVLSDIPEPASLALLGIGLAGLGFTRKKKAH